METKGLQIGNYVRIAVNKEEYNDFALTMKDFKTTKIKLFDPIPLTTQWLERFGLDLVSWFCEESYMVVKDESYGYCMKVRNASHKTSIQFSYFKYVHQLQNLCFALTGEVLKIEQLEKQAK